MLLFVSMLYLVTHGMEALHEIKTFVYFLDIFSLNLHLPQN